MQGDCRCEKDDCRGVFAITSRTGFSHARCRGHKLLPWAQTAAEAAGLRVPRSHPSAFFSGSVALPQPFGDTSQMLSPGVVPRAGKLVTSGPAPHDACGSPAQQIQLLWSQLSFSTHWSPGHHRLSIHCSSQNRQCLSEPAHGLSLP